jgi:hypothetical protein
VYERKTEPLISDQEFVRRLGRQGFYAFQLIAVSVLMGMAGYHWIAGQSWVDSWLNTTMLLGGMGPVGDLTNAPAKVFAGLFALYSGLVFLAVAILLLTPVFHRVLHHFHWEVTSGKQ